MSLDSYVLSCLLEARTLERSLSWRLRRSRGTEPRVNYGKVRRGPGGVSRKVERLAERFPNVERGFNVMYAIGGLYQNIGRCRSAKMAGIPIVYSADGLYYPADCGDDWKERNERIIEEYELADYVLFESEFSRWCHEQLAHKPTCGSEILYNAVDTQKFAPQTERRPSRPLTLLAARLHRHLYCLAPAIAALQIVRSKIPDVRMVIAGKFASLGDELVARAWADKCCVADVVTYSGYYDLNKAPRRI